MLPLHIAMVVDDDRDVNLVLAAVLKLKKFDVHKVYSAEECLDKLRVRSRSTCYLCKWQNSSR
jgi:FixJ family two-component response regulator